MGSSDIPSPSVYSYGSSTVVTLSQEGRSSSDKRVQVGDDYQVIVPKLLSEDTFPSYLELPDPCEPIWSPFAHDLSASEVESYLRSTMETNFNEEQALAMLTYHNFNLSIAREELKKYRPIETQWSENDRISFENAFKLQGKNFSKLQQAVPHKSVEEVVFFYYSWKKPKIKTTVMDRYVEQFRSERPRIYSGLESEDDEALSVFRKRWKLENLHTKIASDDVSGSQAKKARLDESKALIVLEDHDVDNSDTKSEAFESSSSSDKISSVNTFTELPSYMRLAPGQLISLAMSSSTWNEDKLHMKNAIRSLEYEIQSLKRRNNEVIGKLDFNVKDFSRLVSSFRSPQQSSWTIEEEKTCVKALREYGAGNLDAVSFVLGGSKSVAQIKNFLPVARIKYRLTELLSTMRPMPQHEIPGLRTSSVVNSLSDNSAATRGQPYMATSNCNGSVIQNGLNGCYSDKASAATICYRNQPSEMAAKSSFVDDDDDDIVEIFPQSSQKSFNETRNGVSGVVTSN